jgi:hypothetical protein
MSDSTDTREVDALEAQRRANEDAATPEAEERSGPFADLAWRTTACRPPRIS